MKSYKSACLVLFLGSSLQALPTFPSFKESEINAGIGNAGSQGYFLQTGGALTWGAQMDQYLSLRSNVRLGTSFVDTPDPWQIDLGTVYGLDEHSNFFYLREWGGISAVYGHREGAFLFRGNESFPARYYQDIAYLDPGLVAELETGFVSNSKEPIGFFLQYNWTQDAPLWTFGIKIRFYR